MARSAGRQEKWGVSRRPLGRFNAAEGMATTAGRQRVYTDVDTLEENPLMRSVRSWATAHQLLYATSGQELVEEPDITSTHIRNPVGTPGKGIGWCRSSTRDPHASLRLERDRTGGRGKSHRRHHQ